MGVYLYSPTGKREFVKDSRKSTGLIAAGYTFEPKVEEEEKPLGKRDVIAELKELGVDFDKSAGVAELRVLLEEHKQEE